MNIRQLAFLAVTLFLMSSGLSAQVSSTRISEAEAQSKMFFKYMDSFHNYRVDFIDASKNLVGTFEYSLAQGFNNLTIDLYNSVDYLREISNLYFSVWNKQDIKRLKPLVEGIRDRTIERPNGRIGEINLLLSSTKNSNLIYMGNQFKSLVRETFDALKGLEFKTE